MFHVIFRSLFDHAEIEIGARPDRRGDPTRPRAGVRAVTALGRRASPGVHAYRPGLEVHTRLRLGVRHSERFRPFKDAPPNSFDDTPQGAPPPRDSI
jgi:hypothetical protein